jgi:hypothetical protein
MLLPRSALIHAIQLRALSECKVSALKGQKISTESIVFRRNEGASSAISFPEKSEKSFAAR